MLDRAQKPNERRMDGMGFTPTLPNRQPLLFEGLERFRVDFIVDENPSCHEIRKDLLK
jgi:hypothetical protein